DRIMEAFKRVSDQGHRSGLAQKQGSLPDDRLMRQNQNPQAMQCLYRTRQGFIEKKTAIMVIRFVTSILWKEDQVTKKIT
ncbi:hypothetical protein, partial [Xenorhabdus bovienii]|uniref:hypothetical protein n=1 Tax=Xenorhabdus bovienii TaxID=40576 RepID=UPI0023B2F8DD